MSAAEDRVQAAAIALARHWAQTPNDIPKLARVLRNDAWILERAGLLKDPT